VVLTVEPNHSGSAFALGAVGLSIEAQELATRDLNASHESLVVLMRLLGPGVLRIGGNSLDSSWWTSNDKQPPAWATSVVTLADLVSLRGLLAATDWRVILGVDLGHFDPTRAANEARVAEHILGSRLLGIEIGNEPNDYGAHGLRPSSYNPNNYLEDVAAYSATIPDAVPKIRLYGPDLPSPVWSSVITSAKDTPFVAITEHYYPTLYNIPNNGCKGTPVPTALELLSVQVRERENATLQALVEAGAINHRETRISETNSTGSCDADGGPATSPVFVSALWSLDWSLRAASAGVAGLNFHGYFGRCVPDAVSPICAPGDAAEARGQVVARPIFYGLLAARQLEGGHFVPVQVQGQGALSDLSAYATTQPKNKITLAIDNFATDGSTSVLLKVPGYPEATSERLIAPSLSATSGVTFGHASLNADAVFRPSGTTIPKVDGAFRLRLSPTSAVIITLHR
jgi:hypothetical protein